MLILLFLQTAESSRPAAVGQSSDECESDVKETSSAEDVSTTKSGEFESGSIQTPVTHLV